MAREGGSRAETLCQNQLVMGKIAVARDGLLQQLQQRRRNEGD
jgi:hypothetical protein